MVGDAPGGSTVAKGIALPGELSIGPRIVEESSHGTLNRCRARSDELADARVETLGPLGLVTQNQHRAAERKL